MLWDDKKIHSLYRRRMWGLNFNEFKYSLYGKALVLVLSANEEIILKEDEALYIFRWYNHGEKFKVIRINDDYFPLLKRFVEVDNMSLLDELGIPKIVEEKRKVKNVTEEEIDKEIEEIKKRKR